MEEEIAPYEYREGHHWVEYPLQSFEYFKTTCECSPEFHILLGVMRGVRRGNITRGDHSYARLAERATIDGDTDYLWRQFDYLASFGLFTPVPFAGRALSQFERIHGRSYRYNTPNWDHTLPFSKRIWSSLVEQIRYSDEMSSIPEIQTFTRSLIAVRCGLITHGSPHFTDQIMRIIPEVSDWTKNHWKEHLEILGELGFFGGEVLVLNCSAKGASGPSR